TVPNGQIANLSLETLSARDKFWFHPLIGLRYETTPDQMRLGVDGTRQMPAPHAAGEAGDGRAPGPPDGAHSPPAGGRSDVLARDWPHFLEIQEELLLAIGGIVRAAGTDIAFPSQTMYVAGGVNSTTPQLPTPN